MIIMPFLIFGINWILAMKNYMKRYIIGLIVISFTCVTSAKWVEGSIETYDDGFIQGKIYVPNFNVYTSGYNTQDIDLSHFYYSVHFKDLNNDRVVLEPHDIKSFRFKFKGIEYFFISKVLCYNSIIRNERTRSCFLNLIFRGAISMCRMSLTISQNPDNWSIPYHDYYLHNDSIGTIKIEKSKDFNSIKDILRYFRMDERYLMKLPENISIRDVKNILRNYEIWLGEVANKPIHFI